MTYAEILFVFQFFSGDNDSDIVIGYGLFENSMPMGEIIANWDNNESNVKVLSQIYVESNRHNIEYIKRIHCNVFNENSLTNEIHCNVLNFYCFFEERILFFVETIETEAIFSLNLFIEMINKMPLWKYVERY